MLTTIPFSGFYNSVHDSECDYALEQLFSDANGNALGGAFEDAWDAVKWSRVHEQYAKAYAEQFAEEFKLGKIRFDELNSPREYNFTTDRIFVHVGRAAVRRIWRAVDRERFAAHCRDAFTSRSGFSSFYDPDYREWGYVDTWDHNQLGALLQVWADQNADSMHSSREGFDSDAELSLMEDMRGNGYFDNWLCEALTEKGKRLLRIADYLRERENRKYCRRRSTTSAASSPTASS